MSWSRGPCLILASHARRCACPAVSDDCDGLRVLLHQSEECTATARDDMSGHAMRGQLVHIRVDMDDCVLGGGPSAQRPMHGVALVEAGAQHDQHIGRVGEDRGRRVAGARIAEDAERQLVVLREDALGAQRRCDRNGPALCDGPQRRRQHHRARRRRRQETRLSVRPLCPTDSSAASRGRPAQGRDRSEIVGDRRVVGCALAGHHVVRQGQMHRAARLRPHRGERMPEPVIEVAGAGDRHGQARERLHRAQYRRELPGSRPGIRRVLPCRPEFRRSARAPARQSVLAAAMAVAMLQRPGPPIPITAPKRPLARA